MGKTRDTGFLTDCVFTDSSNNVGIGGAASGSYKFQVTGTTNLTGALSGTSATFSGSVTSDDVIFTAGTLFGTGNTGFSNRASDTTLYLQMPATGFNITDNALNTRFILSSAGAATFSSTAQNAFLINSTNTDGPILQIQNSGNNLGLIGNAEGITNGGVTNFAIRATNNLIFSTGGANPRMTITSSGQVLIGTTSTLAGGSLGVNGNLEFGGTAGGNYRITNYQAGFLAFGTDNTERMRITSGGEVLIGGTSTTGSALTIYNSTVGGTGTEIRCTATSGNNVVMYARMAVSGTTSNYFFAAQDNTQDKIYIYGNGNIVNRNNSYGPLSDIKLKENIVDATPKLDKLMQVRIVNYNLIGDDLKQIGVIAQELEQVFPGLVDEHPDRDAEGNQLDTTTKSVKMSVFVPMLIKAIQELSAKVSALENKS